MKARIIAMGVVSGLAILGALVYSPLAQGRDDTSFRARLSGFQETPAVVTSGHGSFRVQLTNATTLQFELTFSDLEGGAPAAAHIHIGQRNVAGGVSAFLCGGSTKPACPVTGTVTGTITPADVVGPAGQGVNAGDFSKLVRAMRAGTTYTNVHNARFQGGEIRGQILSADRGGREDDEN